MLYLLHEPVETETVEEKILPLLKNIKHELVSYPLDKEFDIDKDSSLMLYLPDAVLREIIPMAAKNSWSVSILPHPKNKFTSKGLGISEDIEEVITQYAECENPYDIDLLFCNEVPVFSSVNIGDIFILSKRNGKKNFFQEVINIIHNIRRVSSLSHHSYQLSTDGEKIIHTSALGIIVVEHASSSLISKRLLEESSINDGSFQAFVLAPQNLLVLLWFFVRSLVPNTKTLNRLPSFIGKIKTSNLQVSDDAPMDYTIDGEKKQSKALDFEVHKRAVLLKQKSIYSENTEKENGRKSIKFEGLPKGETRKELIKRSLPILPRASTEQFQDLFKVLRTNSRISPAFMVMMILSTLIATFGLFANSSPVIIGAMILAPVIAPIVSFSMGMVRYDVPMLKESFITITAGTLVSLAFAAGVSIIIPLKVLTPEIEARLSPTLLDMGIAVSSGIAAAYAHSNEGIAKSLAGVAIAVALVPPLAVAGIGIGWWDWEVFSGAILLYATNLAGIILFGGLTFLLLGFAPFKRAKMGLVYTLIIVILVAVPLSLSFDRIMQEANITRSLEGTTIENVVLRDVRIRFGSTMVVSLRLVGPENIEPQRIQAIKEEIEKRIDQPVRLEVVSAMEF
ncbi:DUF389 domain-containing protein [Salinimicrobium sediminilitoris]|uniref:DUF389 domain-containing protein n=1 Tax=Salinimicrobium sediminilitoris TaxID=2876715 RepID=UPI001E5C9B7C|nr:DUF389 domain-containing protein [Salinimicrobium sediminilitoris]MCC8359075.1 DUF389 domain-containing protein [Salinimicrobium sediminilitoris]